MTLDGRAWLRANAPALAGAVLVVVLQSAVQRGLEVGAALLVLAAIASAVLDLLVRRAGRARRALAGHGLASASLLALGVASAWLHPLPRWPAALAVAWSVVAATLEWPPAAWVEAVPARRTRRLLLVRTLRLALLAASGLVLSVTAEVYLRASGRYATWSEQNGGGYISPYTPIRDVAWTFRFAPGGAIHQAQPEFTFDDVANADGLRDVDHPVERAEGELRIVGLGDSFMMGQGAPLEASFLKQLGRGLSARLGRPVRAVSGGIAGSDPVFGYQMLRTTLARHRPELVITLVNSSDVWDLKSRGGLDRFDERGGLRPLPAPWFEPIFARSRLVRAALLSGLSYDWTLLSPAEQEERNRAAASDLLEALAAIEALARTWGGTAIVVLHPAGYELRAKPGRPPEIDLVRELMTARGRPFVDLVARLRERLPIDQLDRYYWPIDGHCTAEGYALFAQLTLEDPLVQAAAAGLAKR